MIYVVSALSAFAAPDATFTTLEPGLELGVFTSPVASSHGDQQIRVLRADPKLWMVDVGLAGEVGTTPQTAPRWLDRNPDWVAVINAGMFQTDYRTSVFQVKHGEHWNNRTWKSNASSVLVFDGAPAALLDVNCDDWTGAQQTHGSWVQSYRLLDCAQNPTWGHKGGRKWSHALIGADDQGRLLFIHARSPWTTRQFTQILLQLPLGVKRLHYAEGGPEASLVVRHGGKDVVSEIGSYETGFKEDDDNDSFWGIPNVVALKRR